MTTTIPDQDVDVIVDVVPYDETDDGNQHLTHIVNPPKNIHIWREGMSAQDVVDIARVQGLEVTALCGYTWVPKRNPEQHDVCQACMDIAGHLMREKGE